MDLSTFENALVEDNSEGRSDALYSDREDQARMETLYFSIHDHWNKDSTPDTLQDFYNGTRSKLNGRPASAYSKLKYF